MPLSFLHHLFHAFTDMLVKDRFIQNVRLGTTKGSYKLERLKRRREDGNDRQISDYPSMSLIGASKPISLQGIP